MAAVTNFATTEQIHFEIPNQHLLGFGDVAVLDKSAWKTRGLQN